MLPLNRLRGQELLDRLTQVAGDLANTSSYKDATQLSASEIARLVPCSKTTVLKYRDVIEAAFSDAGVRFARRNGDVHRQVLTDKVANLQVTIRRLQLELEGMRRHHVNIYDYLIKSGQPLEGILAATARDVQSSVCPVCRRKARLETRALKVVPIRPK